VTNKFCQLERFTYSSSDRLIFQQILMSDCYHFKAWKGFNLWSKESNWSSWSENQKQNQCASITLPFKDINYQSFNTYYRPDGGEEVILALAMQAWVRIPVPERNLNLHDEALAFSWQLWISLEAVLCLPSIGLRQNLTLVRLLNWFFYQTITDELDKIGRLL